MGIFDKIKAKKALKILEKKYTHYPLEEANVVVVLGGDGTILSLINDKSFIKKNIFGMNRGTVGFLMNNYEAVNLLDRIKSSKVTKLNPVYMKVTDIHNKTHVNDKTITQTFLFTSNIIFITYYFFKLFIQIKLTKGLNILNGEQVRREGVGPR